MPYNSYFPVNYGQAYGQAYVPYVSTMQQNNQQNNQQPQPQSSIIWVQGEAGAKSYLVAPNTTVQLWDSERQSIYIKSADASGMPSIKTLDYTIREAAPANAPVTPTIAPETFATKAEVNTLAEQVAALKGEISALESKRQNRPKAEVTSNE